MKISATIGYFPSMRMEKAPMRICPGLHRPLFTSVTELLKMPQTAVVLFLMKCSTLKITQCSSNYSLLYALICDVNGKQVIFSLRDLSSLPQYEPF